ncbi:MAG: lysylphosphatidylglycerol synthase transmembrane domain-containing protein [Candidatus Saccharimonadales bacterium]
MSYKSIIRRHWKLLINIATIAALVVFVYIIRKQIGSTIDNFTHVNGWALVLIVPIEIIDYHVQTKLYQKLFAVVGNKLKYGYLYKISLELNLINHLFPSGGVTGISYFGMRVRDNNKDLSGGKATLIQLMKLALTFISFELLLLIGVVSLAVVGRINELIILVSGVITMLLVSSTILFGYLVGSRERINSFFGAITKGINKIMLKLFSKNPETINMKRAEKVFNDFHDNYQQIMNHVSELKLPFLYAFVANLAEVMAIYVVFLAFGRVVNLGAIILAYGVANFAGLISVLPGGVGIYEGLMIGVLAIAGVPARISLPAIIMYRVVNTLIQLPPGYYYYHKNINRQKAIQQG